MIPMMILWIIFLEACDVSWGWRDCSCAYDVRVLVLAMGYILSASTFEHLPLYKYTKVYLLFLLLNFLSILPSYLSVCFCSAFFLIFPCSFFSPFLHLSFIFFSPLFQLCFNFPPNYYIFKYIFMIILFLCTNIFFVLYISTLILNHLLLGI